MARSGPWDQHETPALETDYDVFDGDRDVGRVYRVDDQPEVWFWGVSFQLTGRKRCGHAPTLDDAKAAFKAEYEAWQSTREG
jgi:hypothetical protein